MTDEGESSDDEEMTIEGLVEQYTQLFDYCTKLEGDLKVQKKENRILIDENNKMLNVNSELKENVEKLSTELESMRKSVRMLNSGTSKLDEILSLGQSPNNHTGVRYIAGEGVKESKFIPTAKANESQLSSQVLMTVGL
ncbi:hypothetical protein LIER_29052 [Lithospermum erythrorhizon]|uniref:Uncharacterized protein n=1 Tax=Lithospermum erythrorhizon TaxID=34254 RepID=A0AAV3RJM5_LITER